MKDTSPLTSLQLAILRVLWDVGECSVNDMVAHLAADRQLAPTTVATLLTRLEKRGAVARRREGRGFVYRALVGREETRDAKVHELAADLFEGDVSHLVHHLLSTKEIAPGDLERVKRLIAEREARSGDGGKS